MKPSYFSLLVVKLKKSIIKKLLSIQRLFGYASPLTEELPDVQAVQNERDRDSRPYRNISRRAFKTYGEFLVYSLFMPDLLAPYTKEASYIISYLASRAAQLTGQYRSNSKGCRVSVIMFPPYAERGLLSRAIASVTGQSYKNWELLLACRSREVAEIEELLHTVGDSRIKPIVVPDSDDCSVAFFKALAVAEGDYFCYLDSVCTFNQDFMLVLSGELDVNTAYDVVYCAQQHVEQSGEERGIRFFAYSRSAHENDDILDASALMHRRALFDLFDRSEYPRHQHFLWQILLSYTEKKPPRPVPAVLSSRIVPPDKGSSVDHIVPHPLEPYLEADRVAAKLPGVALTEVNQMFSLRYTPPPAQRRAVSIIIPSFEAEPFLRTCLDSVRLFTPEKSVELIVVDNASSGAVRVYLQALDRSGEVRVFFNDRNFGFTHAVNRGICAARPDHDIVLLNNDAVVTRGWLDGLQHVFADHPDAGLVVPRQVMLAGTPSAERHQPYRVASRECDVNISALHANVLDPRFNPLKGYMELTFAPFFCVYIPRMVIDQVGLLDVENGPHYRSDRLYCDHVRERTGKRIIYTPFSKVYHFHKRSTTDLQQQDRSMYEKMYVRNNWKDIV
ncbi:glycosyltransferase [Chlorobaculum parvum]|nr:glycosyltransferase [Chlorobaculum parvum]